MIWPAFERQRGHLFYWLPVLMACGIGLYFSLKAEPSSTQLTISIAICVGSLALGLLSGPGPAPFFWLLTAVSAGFLLSVWRADMVAAPKLDFRYYGPITGRIVAVDRSFSDKTRLTLDQVRLEDVRADRHPTRVRVSLHGKDQDFTPEPGAVIHTTGHLSPPEGPVEPGGFDFQRHAWFQGLGAVGYTRKQVIVLERPKTTESLLILYKTRMAISAAVRDQLPERTGGVAAAIMVGDRSAIPRDIMYDLRASNLAHLLAISGLHMGLLTGVVFLAIRTGLALLSRWWLFLPVKKTAAVCALMAATAYLLLSGMSVATERAYIMVVVMLGAVLLSRRAISLRSVALAALIVLALRPEALIGPGFQMSFAATTALVVAFGALQRLDLPRMPGVLRPISGAFLSSLIAGAATAPIAAAHFNQIAQLGLVANVLSVPIMALVVMPAAVLAACLAPLGLASLGLFFVHWGLAWILMIAEWIAGLDGALSFVVTPGKSVLPLLAAGFLFIALWQGRFRWAGMAPVIAALFLWAQTERPTVLVAANGALIGVMTDQGRTLSRAKGNGFAARAWLENDGDAAAQRTAHERGPPPRGQGVWEYAFGQTLTLRHLSGKTGLKQFTTCSPGDLVILTHRVETGIDCQFYDLSRLRRTGSLALFIRPDGEVDIRTAREVSGDRLWNLPTTKRPERRLALNMFE